MPDNKMSLKLIPGVIETGLFVSTADLVIVRKEDRAGIIRK